MDSFLLGLSLGLGAGVAPGPLLALVIRTTLQDGAGAGIRVAFSPLLTDVPIIALALVLAASLPEAALGALGIAGGAFVIWLGVEALRESPAQVEAAAGAAAPQRDLLRGALTNALSPHPWVFWLTVGAPILAQGDAADSVLFLVAFYLLLIGVKVAVALAIGAGRGRLTQGRGYVLLLRGSALLLLVTGVLLAVEGVRTLA
jgi:threonine/homoserine/homoserine lactone efflux protein